MKTDLMSSNVNSQTKSQSFKKKNTSSVTDQTNTKSNDKFEDLKSKLQKQKQIMKKTGKRFRDDVNLSSQQISISTNQNSKIESFQNSKHDISVGPQQVLKQQISLKDLNVSDNNLKLSNQLSSSSQLFDKQIKNQKMRSEQVYNFLKSIQLQKFASALIQNGFDELQSIVYVTTEDLNHIMMRASQQIRLLQQIGKLKLKLKVQQSHKLVSQQKQLGTTNTLFRTKTEPMQQNNYRIKTGEIIKASKKNRKQQQGDKNDNLKPGSFLFTVGSRNWSTEDQIRRACSVCFKVQQQMQKKGQCYYCQNCYKYVSQDLLEISLIKDMNRSYVRQK